MSRSHTALVVPVPEAEPLIGPWRRRLTPSGAAGMPAHATILYPFLEPDELAAELPAVAAIVAREPRFSFALRALGRFGDRVLYLAPEPSHPFVALAARVQEQYPDRLPYDGAHAEVVPHVTVASTEDAAAIEEAERALSGALPLACVAEEAGLFELVEGVWTVRARLPFGG